MEMKIYEMALCIGLMLVALVGVPAYRIISSVLQIKRRKRCIESVNAEVVDYSGEMAKGGRKYWPVVEYTYNGHSYRQQLDCTYGDAKFMKKNYPMGKYMTIYLNPEKPEFVTDGKNGMDIFYILAVVVAWILLAMLVSGVFD